MHCVTRILIHSLGGGNTYIYSVTHRNILSHKPALWESEKKCAHFVHDSNKYTNICHVSVCVCNFFIITNGGGNCDGTPPFTRHLLALRLLFIWHTYTHHQRRQVRSKNHPTNFFFSHAPVFFDRAKNRN